MFFFISGMPSTSKANIKIVNKINVVEKVESITLSIFLRTKTSLVVFPPETQKIGGNSLTQRKKRNQILLGC